MDTAPLPNPIVPGIYRTRCGGVADITATDPAAVVDDAFPVVGRHGVAVETWTPDGRFIGLEQAHPFDLVERIPLYVASPSAITRAENYPKPLDRRTRCAMAALQGLLADPKCTGAPEQFAKEAVRYADALLAELDKPTEPKP
jgi:hypothetical protein